MKVIILHYGNYMARLSMRKFLDEYGNTYWSIDEDTRDRLQSKLMQANRMEILCMPNLPIEEIEIHVCRMIFKYKILHKLKKFSIKMTRNALQAIDQK
ncbi:hypothetical protein J32TS6_38230 [Virgibacillus pantothenticus]|uniref:helix-turn-helix domain-containing protein n=1 Tax=Virgibacillus pantothenticus TaxID=1473 RepID=UPI000954D32E|nr:helix-turn-helix domain-containing protein [Virgibacillus pantothenticus]GIP65268.1 hypothetical protein J32TS6_38230 [Virgibacillus pantothenticus]SIS62459.1 Helix-turn-helix domain-containing protein [Virgibacillus pantothenticus]